LVLTPIKNHKIISIPIDEHESPAVKSRTFLLVCTPQVFGRFLIPSHRGVIAYEKA
jgi:hypothetical protein